MLLNYNCRQLGNLEHFKICSGSHFLWPQCIYPSEQLNSHSQITQLPTCTCVHPYGAFI